MNMQEWIERWSGVIPAQARAELHAITWPHDVVKNDANESGQSESAVQADIRLTASRQFGAPLWRNNNGAAQMINPRRPDDPARHVRFGLGNDSKKINDAWKSSDLIGICPVNIGPQHLGRTLGVFTAVEVKQPGWHLTDGDKRAHAQMNFMTGVHRFGGLAGFAQSTDDFARILSGVR